MLGGSENNDGLSDKSGEPIERGPNTGKSTAAENLEWLMNLYDRHSMPERLEFHAFANNAQVVDTEDAFHDKFLELLQHMPVTSTIDYPDAWLSRVLKFRIVDGVRKAARLRALLREYFEQLESAGTDRSLEQVDLIDFMAIIEQKCLRNDRDRELFQLNICEGLSQPDTAREMGLTQNQVVYWRRELLERAFDLLGGSSNGSNDKPGGSPNGSPNGKPNGNPNGAPQPSSPQSPTSLNVHKEG